MHSLPAKACGAIGVAWKHERSGRAQPLQAAAIGAPEFASAAVDDSRSARAFGTLQFRDNQPLVNRLKRIQAWPLLTIWDSGAATLYVGVNRDGEPGVHLRQKRKDRGASRRAVVSS